MLIPCKKQRYASRASLGQWRHSAKILDQNSSTPVALYDLSLKISESKRRQIVYQLTESRQAESSLILLVSAQHPIFPTSPIFLSLHFRQKLFISLCNFSCTKRSFLKLKDLQRKFVSSPIRFIFCFCREFCSVICGL